MALSLLRLLGPDGQNEATTGIHKEQRAQLVSLDHLAKPAGTWAGLPSPG